MKKHSIYLSLCLLCMLLCALAPASAQAEQAEFIDYVSQLDFNRGSETVKAEVTVKTFVDGDFCLHGFAGAVEIQLGSVIDEVCLLCLREGEKRAEQHAGKNNTMKMILHSV